MQNSHKRGLTPYLQLIRFEKPIGTLLLLWPTLWALWLAAAGRPEASLIAIFMTGVFLTRSAGCVVNDLADRKFDSHVARTRNRPLASGKVSVPAAMMLVIVLALLAFSLVLFCNALTVKLAFIGAALAVIYPFLKRVTNLPQVGLGLTFAWSVPMAFAATTNSLSMTMWWLFAAAMLWPVMYDTMYAMVDRQDDIKIGVKSTAILFGNLDVPVIISMQMVLLVMLLMVGRVFDLHAEYYISLIISGGLFAYQYTLIKDRDPQKCFKAFLNNNWVGLVVFLGIVTSYL